MDGRGQVRQLRCNEMGAARFHGGNGFPMIKSQIAWGHNALCDLLFLAPLALQLNNCLLIFVTWKGVHRWQEHCPLLMHAV